MKAIFAVLLCMIPFHVYAADCSYIEYPDQAEIDKHKPIIYTLVKNCPGILQSELKRTSHLTLKTLLVWHIGPFIRKVK